jgi:DNA-binding protein HU-beta
MRGTNYTVPSFFLGGTVNKNELVDWIARQTRQNQITKTDIEEVLNASLDIIKKTVKRGDDVTLMGFGTFTKARRKARAGRDPQSGQEIKIPAMTVPRFRPGKEFKEALR